MLKLTATALIALGAPQKGGAQDIEDWLRTLLKPGAIRTEAGLIELRGAEPVVTTLGELKKACTVAVETIKHGLRALEMDHWVALVDGAHTRLLGPPRFSVSITKENLWGSVGKAIEVGHAEGLSPLESIDYDQLRHTENICDRKPPLSLETVTLNWVAEVRLPNRTRSNLKADENFTLAAGSQVRDENGHVGVLGNDLKVKFVEGRNVQALDVAEFSPDAGAPIQLEAKATILLERSSIIRLATGQTGILEVRPQAQLSSGAVVDWGDDSHWLARFRNGRTLVFLRRAVFVQLRDVVTSIPPTHNSPTNEWRVAMGVHECFLDGSIPFLAGECSLRKSPSKLAEYLKHLGPADSLRGNIEKAFGFTVGAADVRISPTLFASAYDRKLLLQVAQRGDLNSEVLSLSHKLPCWTQVGAYYRRGELLPWEITREVYFTFVDVRIRQSVPNA